MVLFIGEITAEYDRITGSFIRKDGLIALTLKSIKQQEKDIVESERTLRYKRHLLKRTKEQLIHNVRIVDGTATPTFEQGRDEEAVKLSKEFRVIDRTELQVEIDNSVNLYKYNTGNSSFMG